MLYLLSAEVSTWAAQIGGSMDQRNASAVGRPWNLVTLPNGSGLVHPDQTSDSLQDDEMNVTAQIQLDRWEDDGGAIGSHAPCSPARVADFHNAAAA